MNQIADTLKVVQVPHGLSDTVLLSIIGALLTIATLIIKAIIESHAKKAERIAEAEAAKVAEKLKEVEIKIDGRLTQLLKISGELAEERGLRLGKEQAKNEEVVKAKESTPPVHLPGETKLKIIEGEIKVTQDPKKKK